MIYPAIDIELGRTNDEMMATDFRAAEALFANQGMHRVARAFVASHPRAIQYLSQAPVLAMTASSKTMGHRLHSWFQMRIVGACDRGVQLKVMMRIFNLPLPLRKLSGYACEPSLDHVVRALASLDSAVLGRIIPEKPGAQRAWMRNLGRWIDNASRRQRLHRARFEWAAINLVQAKNKAGISELSDFAISDDSGFSEAWGLKRAREEMERWHTRLSVTRALKDSPISPDTVVDFGPHPNKASVNGYTFHALRTPVEIAEEGAAMHHCVASYIGDVINGRCSIVSIMQGGQRIATLEIAGGMRRQLKGPCNATPPKPVGQAVTDYLWTVGRGQEKAA